METPLQVTFRNFGPSDVNVTVPDAEMVANRESNAHHAYTDVYAAIRDAFDSLDRQLIEHARCRDEPAPFRIA